MPTPNIAGAKKGRRPELQDHGRDDRTAVLGYVIEDDARIERTHSGHQEPREPERGCCGRQRGTRPFRVDPVSSTSRIRTGVRLFAASVAVSTLESGVRPDLAHASLPPCGS